MKLLAAAVCLIAAPTAIMVSACGDQSSGLPSVSYGSPRPTVAAASGDGASVVVKDGGAVAGKATISIGAPEPLQDVNDAAAKACATLIATQGDQGPAIAVPITIAGGATSSRAGSMAVGISSVWNVTSGASVASPNGLVAWGVTYSNVAPQCQQGASVSVNWSQPSTQNTWSAWLVVGADEEAADSLLLEPMASVGLAGRGVEFADPPGDNVVSCDADDPAAGSVDYIAVDPVVALDNGCLAAGTEPGEESAATDNICGAAYPARSERITNGVTDENRQGSLFAVCEGFGAPSGMSLTPDMACALVAASATFAGASDVGSDASNACSATSIVTDLRSGRWLSAGGDAGDAACGYFADAFAGGAGVLAAGATSETGPGAVAVGVGTYRAFAGGLGLACGGLFGGQAKALGTSLESHHETDVAVDVVRHGLCLRYNPHAVLKFWSAIPCESRS